MDLAARVARLTPGQKACLDLVDDHATSKEIAVRLGISRHTVDARLRQAIQILGVMSRREAAVIWRAAASAEGYQQFTYQSPEIVSEPDAQDERPASWTGDDHVGSTSEAGGEAPDMPAGDNPGRAAPPPAGVIPPPALPGGYYAAPPAADYPHGTPPSAYPPVMPPPGYWAPPAGYHPASGQPLAGPSSEVRDGITWGHPGTAPASPMLPRLWGGANDLSIPHRLAAIMIVMILGMLAFGLLLSGIGALTQLRL